MFTDKCTDRKETNHQNHLQDDLIHDALGEEFREDKMSGLCITPLQSGNLFKRMEEILEREWKPHKTGE